MTEFLTDYTGSKQYWRDTPDKAAEKRGVYTARQWEGQGDRNPLNVAYGTAADALTKTDMAALYKARHGRGAAPVVIIIAYPHDAPDRATLAGPPLPGENQPQIVDVGLAQAERIARAALDEPSRLSAERYLIATLERNLDELPGVTNKGLLATHELVAGVPQRPDWNDATASGKAAMKKRDHELMRALGFAIEQQNNARVLKDATSSQHRAVAVFLQAGERPDASSGKYNGQTPVTYALAQADQQNLRWVVTVKGGNLRLYSTATSGAAGQRGRTDTYVELDLPLLPDEQAGYLHLLFSTNALKNGGTVDQIRAASLTYTTGLAERLRERVYDDVVPRVALAIAEQQPDLPLDEVYRAALTVLFRLLFLAYGEDQRLLPYDPTSGNAYSDHALKTAARRMADTANAGRDLGFDNPLTPQVEPTTDPTQSDLWDRCLTLFGAVNEGHRGWGIPAYNGGLFSSDPDRNPVGPIIDRLDLTNGQFGPALFALLIDRRPDDITVGPIDFRSLSVREFGTIYEGLLESELARADQPLKLVARKNEQVYEPADDAEGAAVQPDEVYLHNKSGARKASGSFFTKPFAVEHLLDKALVPTLHEHLDRVNELLDASKPADAARLLFDFRTADISMGSGHFLTAVVDTIEKHMSAFLAEHPISQVTAELDALRDAAIKALPDDWDGEIEQGALLRRLIARRCVYGIDLNPISVELARVAMWIHTFVPGLPLSFLDHNLIVGNSLTGIATLHEVEDAFDEATKQNKGKGRGSSMLGMAAIDDALAAADGPLERLRALNDATVDDVHAAADAADDARDALGAVFDLCNLVVAARVGDLTLPDPFVDGIDLLDLPDTMAQKARDLATEVDAAHLPVAFPEVFRRSRPGFDVIVGNPPWEEMRFDTDKFWARHFPGHGALTGTEKEEARSRYGQERPDLVNEADSERESVAAMSSALKAGPDAGSDLAISFCKRATRLIRERGRLAYVLPNSATLGAAKTWVEWRQMIANRGYIEHLTNLSNRNEWVFDGVDSRYCVVLLAWVSDHAEPATRTEIAGRFYSKDAFDKKAGSPLVLAWQDLPTFTPGKGFLPAPPTHGAGHLLASFLEHPRLDDDRVDFSFESGSDVTAAQARACQKKSTNSPELQVVEGKHLSPWTPPSNVPTISADALPSAIARRTEAPRFAYKKFARPDDTFTVWTAPLPPGSVVKESAYFIDIDADIETRLCAYGIISSLPFNWQARTWHDFHILPSLFGQFRLPVISPGPLRDDIVATVRALLPRVDFAAWGGTYTSGGTAPQIARLDAAAAAAYGFSADDLGALFDTFHATQDWSVRRDAALDQWKDLP